MARVHDESLSFILSDQAIGAIAATLPPTETEIRGTICLADSSTSPSPVVCSHFEDFGILMFPDSATKDDDLGCTILQWHLGSNGRNCPLSTYNYNLPSSTIPKLSNRPVLSASNMLADGKKRKFPVYDCRVIAKDGQFLRYCSRREMRLFIDRDIAKLVEDDPPTIMLVSEFEGCYGCGEDIFYNYRRYRIIPLCYVRWFPEHLKWRFQKIEHLCLGCDAIVHAAAVEYKEDIAKEFEIPLKGKPVSSDVRSAATALLLNGSKLPPERFEQFTKTVASYYGGREVTNEDLERAALVGVKPKRLKKKGLATCLGSNQHGDDYNISAAFENPKDEVTNLASSSDLGESKSELEGDSLSHGKLVVEYLLKKKGEEGIHQFCKTWRQVFTDALHLG